MIVLLMRCFPFGASQTLCVLCALCGGKIISRRDRFIFFAVKDRSYKAAKYWNFSVFSGKPGHVCDKGDRFALSMGF
jgi:hypothetical protein